MLEWVKQYKWWIILGIVLTFEAVQYEYARRGSIELGSEYVLIFLPVFVHIINKLWTDTKEMLDENLSEGWVDK